LGGEDQGRERSMFLREVETILVLGWLDRRGLKDGDAEEAIISEIVGSY